jgi:hypothetical protein
VRRPSVAQPDRNTFIVDGRPGGVTPNVAVPPRRRRRMVVDGHAGTSVRTPPMRKRFAMLAVQPGSASAFPVGRAASSTADCSACSRVAWRLTRRRPAAVRVQTHQLPSRSRSTIEFIVSSLSRRVSIALSATSAGSLGDSLPTGLLPPAATAVVSIERHGTSSRIPSPASVAQRSARQPQRARPTSH